ncbi:hypothetical protein [Sphingobium yanoikuyae]|jgi:hypothetical protein|uniref:Uncharacterized protein n=1 Tax=Sphingobium yanoikuyae TaxID=13690 RepID=A0A430BDD0_SPHYA|nr:hypothetical protein [Sphingobium yanoikuyae]RSU46769.1 hypothetical protein DAH51_25485 [Sphingobium yanoikuyae]
MPIGKSVSGVALRLSPRIGGGAGKQECAPSRGRKKAGQGMFSMTIAGAMPEMAWRQQSICGATRWSLILMFYLIDCLRNHMNFSNHDFHM